MWIESSWRYFKTESGWKEALFHITYWMECSEHVIKDSIDFIFQYHQLESSDEKNRIMWIALPRKIHFSPRYFIRSFVGVTIRDQPWHTPIFWYIDKDAIQMSRWISIECRLYFSLTSRHESEIPTRIEWCSWCNICDSLHTKW